MIQDSLSQAHGTPTASYQDITRHCIALNIPILPQQMDAFST